MKKLTAFSIALLWTLNGHTAPIQQYSLSGTNSSLPAPNTATSTANNTVANPMWNLYQQIEQLQEQVRQLRGQLEEQDNKINQLNNELQNRYTDLDQRLQLLQQKVDPESVDSENDNSDEDNRSTAEPPAMSSANNAGTTNNNDNRAAASADRQAYNLAYKAYQDGGAVKAIAPMKQFIRDYPNSPYISHAYYWLAEFNLSITPPNFNQAKNNFTVVARDYTTSAKAPAALLRLVEIAYNVDKDTPKARQYYQLLLKRYPDSKEAKQAQKDFKL